MNGQKFSLSFSKKIEKKSLQPSALRSEGRAEVKDTKQVLLEVDQDSLKVDENAGEEEQLIIPLLQAKRSAVLSRLAKLYQEDGVKGAEGEKKGEEGKEEAKQEEEVDDKLLTLEEKAERALLEESRRRLDDWTTRDGKKDITIPAAVNDDPLAAPLVDIGKESSLDDYDEIGVESFGAAVLRGMGWKKSEGIGGREKRVIEILDPSSKTLGSSEGRPGVGEAKDGDAGGECEEELPILKGSFVFLHSGRHRGTYGVVEVVDEDHVLIRAAMGQAVVREVEGNLRVATEKEYKESSRVINKEMYDKFKEAEIKKKNEARKKKEDSESDRDRDRDRKATQRTKTKDKEESQRITNSSKDTIQRNTDSEKAKGSQENSEEERNRKPRERDTERQREKNERLIQERPKEKNIDKERERDNERNRNRDRDEERQRRHREKDDNRQKYKETKEYDKEERKDRTQDHKESERRNRDPYLGPPKDPLNKRRHEEENETQSKIKVKQMKIAPPWVRENLRVRIINKNYKGGKYHKQKVVVVSVVTAESCECVGESGRPLCGVDPAWFETVIPKHSPMVVMVVKGPYAGQKGRILQLHKDEEQASIQLLEDETSILKLHYDDICEYVMR